MHIVIVVIVVIDVNIVIKYHYYLSLAHVGNLAVITIWVLSSHNDWKQK